MLNMKIALRSLLRHKGYSLLNIGGLALGLACCFMILRYIAFETSYDAFHEKSGRIYRVVMTEYGEDQMLRSAQTYAPLAPIVSGNLPDIESVVRILPWSVTVKTPSNELFQEPSFLFADSLFFQMFSFGFVSGNEADALKSPHSLVLTRSASARFFGTRSSVGETLMIEGRPFRVIGVVEDPPANSSIQFELVAPMLGAKNLVGEWLFQDGKSWHWPPVYTFCTLTQQGSPERINSMLPSVMLKHLGGDFLPKRDFQLQPLTEIHTASLYENELVPTTNELTLILLGTIAVMILALAGINYTNLATARSLTRAKEVGLRKVSGAGRGMLVRQFLGESVVYAFFALVVAVAVSELLMPLFAEIAGAAVTSTFQVEMPMVGAILLLTILVGIAGGAYPAFVLSSFQPIRVLHGRGGVLAGGSRVWNLRSVLVILQFVISLGLIIGTLAIEEQLSFISKKDLGFRKDQTVVIPIKDEDLQAGFQVFKNSILSLNGVVSASALSNFPWERGFYGFPVSISGKGREQSTDMPTILVEHDFVKTLEMTIVSGRDFSPEFGTDKGEAFIVNEEALRQYGFDDPVGFELTMKSVSAGTPKKGKIIGVVKDFHFQSLHRKIEPLVMTVAPQPYYLDNLIVHLDQGHIQQALAGMESLWARVSPDRPFDYFFLDEAFDDLYRSEQRLGKMFTVFSTLAIVIGCLGLFGLASYTIHLRMKEVGIRKVLGASLGNIAALFSREFVILVGISFVIAGPIAYLTIDRWLDDFAYRIDMQIWMFASAAGIALLAILVTVSTQALRAAMENPVEALKNE